MYQISLEEEHTLLAHSFLSIIFMFEVCVWLWYIVTSHGLSNLNFQFQTAKSNVIFSQRLSLILFTYPFASMIIFLFLLFHFDFTFISLSLSYLSALSLCSLFAFSNLLSRKQRKAKSKKSEKQGKQIARKQK
jgi:hypothetical protein